MGPCLSDANRHGDIYLCNTCLGDICSSYQRDLSCDWSNLTKHFGPHPLFFSRTQNFSDLNSFWAKKFLTSNFYWSQIIPNLKIFGTHIISPKFGLEKFFDPKFFFSEPEIFGLFLSNKIFFCDLKLCIPNSKIFFLFLTQHPFPDLKFLPFHHST